MKDDELIKPLNQYLKDYFPHFRLVWSEDQFEKRHGTFVKHYPIYQEITEVREVPKYPILTTPCYVLETKAYYSGDEIKNHNGWDIAFPFLDTNGDAVFPTMEVVAFMMNELVTLDKKPSQTANDAEESDKKAFDKEVEQIEEALSE